MSIQGSFAGQSIFEALRVDSDTGEVFDIVATGAVLQIPVEPGRSIFPLDVTVMMRGETSAQSTGLFGTIVGGAIISIGAEASADGHVGEALVELGNFEAPPGVFIYGFDGRTPGRIYTIECVPGNVDCDGQVDLLDFNVLKGNFGRMGDELLHQDGDLNFEREVGLDDFAILKRDFGQSAAVSEPGTRALLLSALAGLACRRWRRLRPRAFARAIIVTAILLCPLANYSRAVPTKWEVNGHWYAVARRTGSWELAKARSEEAGGYLATITSALENDFIFNLVQDPTYWGDLGGGPIGPWLGGFQDALPENEPALGWQWVTGEPFEYENWLAGEPNNASDAENWLILGGLVGQSSPVSTWGDAPSPFNPVRSFVDEWNALPRFAFGDLDGDAIVGLPDFSILKNHFGQRANPTEGDLTLDGGVNLDDFNVMKQYFGTSLGDNAPVPEPSSLALLLSAVAGLWIGSRQPQTPSENRTCSGGLRR